MKSLWKYITGFVSFVIGILVLSNKKNKKIKEIKGKIDSVKSKVKKVDSKIESVKENFKRANELPVAEDYLYLEYFK